MTTDLRINGCGRHSKVVAESAKQQRRVSFYVVRDGAPRAAAHIAGTILQQLMDQTCTPSFTCGTCSAGRQYVRYPVPPKYTRPRCASVCLPRAMITASVHIGLGGSVVPGEQISPEAQIDDHALINIAAIIDRSAHISFGAHNTLGATLSGDVRCGAFTRIGTRAIVTQGVRQAACVVMGMGASDQEHRQRIFGLGGKPGQLLRAYQSCI